MSLIDINKCFLLTDVDVFKTRFPKEYIEIIDFVKCINKKYIPKFIPEWVKDKFMAFPSIGFTDFSIPALREEAIKEWGYVLLCDDWIKQLAEYIRDKKCLEIMAGTGSLTYALKQHNCNIIATDNYSWHENVKEWNMNKWVDIENLEALKAIEKYGTSIDFIIMAWPPYSNIIAYDCLLKMREINPNCKLIYIGEDVGGCNATDEFFRDGIEIDIDIHIPSWWGLHDNIMVFE